MSATTIQAETTCLQQRITQLHGRVSIAMSGTLVEFPTYQYMKQFLSYCEQAELVVVKQTDTSIVYAMPAASLRGRQTELVNKSKNKNITLFDRNRY